MTRKTGSWVRFPEESFFSYRVSNLCGPVDSDETLRALRDAALLLGHLVDSKLPGAFIVGEVDKACKSNPLRLGKEVDNLRNIIGLTNETAHGFREEIKRGMFSILP